MTHPDDELVDVLRLYATLGPCRCFSAPGDRLVAVLARAADVIESQIPTAQLDRGVFDPSGWFVYVLWPTPLAGADGSRPLYVGSSRNVLARVGSHLSRVHKATVVGGLSLERCSTEWVMRCREYELIETLNPVWNLQGVVEAERHAAPGEGWGG